MRSVFYGVLADCQHLFFLLTQQVFGHIASDAILKPVGHFADSPLALCYPSMCAGDFVELELAAINLKKKQDSISNPEDGSCEQQKVEEYPPDSTSDLLK